MKRGQPLSMPQSLLGIVRDLMLGGRHSRHTVAKSAQVSLPTADRWLKTIIDMIPHVRWVKVGKTSWYEWTGARE